MAAELPGRVTELLPPHSYHRAPPDIAGCWSTDPALLAYFYNTVRQRDAACPAEYLLQLPHAYVYEGRYVLTPDGAWLPPSITDYNAASKILPVIQGVIAARQGGKLPAGKPVVVIAKAGSDNYGHTLVEIMPRLINIARSPLRDIRLVLPAGMAAWTNLIELLLARLGIAAEFIVEPVAHLMMVEDLYYFGPVSQHNVRKSTTLLLLRNLICDTFSIKAAPRRKLFIDRRGAESRSIINAAETHDILQARGWEIVHPVGLSFAEQVALFSQASHIAGPLGAGMTNILFAPAGCRVTMIDPGLADYFFWDLAALAGQPFTWLFTGPVTHYSQALASAAYQVNPDGLRYVLDTFG